MSSPAASRSFVGRGAASRILSTLLDDALLSDVRVCAGAKSFPCHRAILSACSPVFAAMFVSPMREPSTGHVSLEDVPADVFAAVRLYMYGRPLHISDAHALAASAFIRRYEVCLPELTDFLDALLASALTLDNVLAIRAHADMHAAHRLQRNCDRFLTARMRLLAENDIFLSSHFADAEAALRAPSRVSKTAAGPRIAQHALAAAVAWLLHDEVEREHCTDVLLTAVDVDGLSLPALVRASRDPIAGKSKAFQARLLRAFARKAERDLGFAPLPGAGFAVVDDPLPGRYGPEVGLFPYPAAHALYQVRRRSTLGAGPLVHPRFPQRQPVAGRGSTQTGTEHASEEEEER